MTEEIQEHATRSPSGAHGWRRCPGKIDAEKGFPDRVGREAAEGTVFHEAAELCLRHGFEPHDLKMGKERLVSGHLVSYNMEMRDNLYDGLEILAAIMSDPDWIFGIEARVYIGRYTLEKGGFGTSDFWAVNLKKRIILIFDWKYGKIAVSPIENDQAELYGLGVWETVAGELFGWDPRDITVRFLIWQPRVPDGGGEWETTMEWLLEEGQNIVLDASLTYSKNARRIAGPKQCAYCRAKKKCPEYLEWNARAIGLRFDDIDEDVAWDRMAKPPRLANQSRWTPEQRSYVWLHRGMIIKWLKAVGEDIQDDYQKGLPTPFIKVTEGRGGDRVFREEYQKNVETYLADRLGDKAFVPEKLISVSVAESLIGKAQFKEDLGKFVYSPPGKPTLAPITSKKPALAPALAAFDEIEEEEE